MKTGQLLQIQTVQGKQVADFVAFTQGETDEYLSTSATRATNGNIIPQLGMTLYSNRRQPMFEIVADTVGRHDMLYACCDPVRYEMLEAPPGHASCREALTEALTRYSIGYDRIPSPINWFMNVSIQQRGELEIREPLAEAGDYVLLRAVKDVIAAVSACPQDLGPTNAFNPTELVIRVYRDAPLPEVPVMANGSAPEEPPAAVVHGSAGAQPSDGEEAEEQPARRATRRAEKRAASTAEGDSSDPSPPSETAQSPGNIPAGARASAGPPSTPGRLADTAEATVVRVEHNVSDSTV